MEFTGNPSNLDKNEKLDYANDKELAEQNSNEKQPIIKTDSNIEKLKQ